jgi:pimeloyl-ACP methyl ester carboxylesterase
MSEQERSEASEVSEARRARGSTERSKTQPAPPLPEWLAGMMPAGARRSLLEVSGGLRVCLTEVGEGRPVFLLHGNPTWSFLWRKVAIALSGAPIRLVMPDLIGLGYSDKPRSAGAHSFENHARRIGEVMDRAVAGPMIAVVQDWGGPIAMRALADRPERLAGLVVLNTALSPPKRDFRPSRFHRFARVPVVSQLAFRLLGFPQNALFTAQGDRSSIRGQVARAYRHPLRRLRDRAAPLALARMVPDSFEHPSIEPLRRVQAFTESFDGPAAIVWGDRDPVLGRVRSWIEQLLPQAEVTRTRAGHFLQEEVPHPIADAIRHVAAQLTWL